MDEMSADDADTREEPVPAPYKICIVPSSDGTFQVYTEPMAQEEPEVGEEAMSPTAGASSSEERYQDYATMEEALKKVIAIYKENPVSSDERTNFLAGAEAEGQPYS